MSKSSALTPRAKGSGKGREIHPQGPMIMSPSGDFHPVPAIGENDEIAMDADDNNEPEEFAFPVDDGNNAVPPSSSSSAAAEAFANAADRYSEVITRELYGGAIKMSLPSSFDDVSAIRQVPDHQEVFVDRFTEMSLIIEILSYEEGVSDAEAARHFFNDLAQYNDSTNVTIEDAGVVTDLKFMPKIRSSCPRCALVGRQAVEKFGKGGDADPNAVVDLVDIFLVVLRLPIVQTDILITLNAPQGKIVRKTSVASDPVRKPLTIQSFLPSDVAEAMGESESLDRSAIEIMRKAVDSFNIVDWSLFA